MSADTAKCKKCFSERTERFNGEVAIHFLGLEGVDKPIVWVFPDLTICLSCGVAEFEVPKEQLGGLQHGATEPN